MDDIYALIHGDLALLAEEIGQVLKDRHGSTIMADRTTFVSEDSCCQIDTYQVYELNCRGYITVNIYFFRPKLIEEALQVKVSVFSPGLNGATMKTRKLQKEIDLVIRAHMP